MGVQLEKYHEQAQLLDPLLATLVTPLSAVLRREANSESEPDMAAVQTASRFLWALVTVRSILIHPCIFSMAIQHPLSSTEAVPCLAEARANDKNTGVVPSLQMLVGDSGCACDKKPFGQEDVLKTR